MTRTGDLVIGLDCSTTATKAVVWDAAGREVASGRRTFALRRPHPGWHEQDPADWWRSTAGAVTDAMSGLDADRITAIATAHQRESFACLDTSGAALRPAILWVDGRAGQQIRTHGSEHVHELSGKPPDVTPALYKLLWLRENEPEMLQRSAMVTDVHGYLVHAMTGSWTTSLASADPLGLVDMRSGTWSPELLAMVGLDQAQLPGIAQPGDVVGELTPGAAQALGLNPGTLVVAGAGDGQSAGLGAGVTDPGPAYLNLGTAVVAGAPSADYRHSTAFRTLTAATPGSYIFETLLSSGTYLVSWFVENFGAVPELGLGLTPEQVLEAAAAGVGAGADGLLMLPYLNAAQTPYWDPDARGAVVGWHGSHGRAHLYRAVMEAIAYELRLHTEGLDGALAVPVDRFLAMGGGSRSPLWAQLIADVCQRPVQLCRSVETTALGAGILAAAAVGLGGTNDIRQAAAAMSGIGRTFEPDERSAEVYDGFYAVYRDLYPALKGLFPRLAEAAHRARDLG